ncbi:hypothetical protein EVAR_61181_1 [Eumeta japonica]|uniref:Uncharacterized protein n=1 Tax=Eumeta variegata TaxID=151549 RepID=A0A4C1ZKV4_EUMVA|nr:hypothetical protein EVAR_61181_1 [Eumeta japonica]
MNRFSKDMGAVDEVLPKAFLDAAQVMYSYKNFLYPARSPVFTHLSATLAGLPTIRASQAQSAIQNEFDKLQASL